MNYLGIIGNEKQLKSTLILYQIYEYLIDNDKIAYVCCSEEKHNSNECQFGKLISVDVSVLQRIKVRLITNYHEYLNILCVLSKVDINYSVLFFDDLSQFIDNNSNRMNLFLSLIKQIKLKVDSKIPYQIISCFNSIDIQVLKYHNFFVAECILNSKLYLKKIEIIKVMNQIQKKYVENLFEDVAQLITDCI